MSNLKSFKLDLGGGFPAKSEAVQRHAFELGYEWEACGRHQAHTDQRYLFFGIYAGGVAYANASGFERYRAEQITAEKFLELTKDDVVEKPKTEKAWRYVVSQRDNHTLLTGAFVVEREGILYNCNGMKLRLYTFDGESGTPKRFKKYGDPIEVPYVEIKE